MSIYDEVSKATGVPRDDVKKVAHALLYRHDQVVEVDREIFHQMMRQLSGGQFGGDAMCSSDVQKMKLVAEKMAHATAERGWKMVEVVL